MVRPFLVLFYLTLMDNETPTRPWWMLPPGPVNPWWWTVVGAGLVGLTYAVGPDTGMPALSVLPVCLAAWYSGRQAATALSVLVTGANVWFLLSWWPVSTEMLTLVAEALLRGVVITIMGLWFARLSEHERQLHRYVVKLEGLLPICSFCKAIRNEAGVWERLESFMVSRSDAEFTHGFCPTCTEAHYS